MTKKKAIAVMDSGVGGLSILNALTKLLPEENYVYLSDNKNAPYGLKSDTEIQDFCRKAVDLFVSKDCKIIIIACNTATTAAIHVLRKEYPKLEFIGVEPAIKPAAELSKTKNIGVLATERTLQTFKFNNTKEKFAKEVSVHTQAGYQLVEMIEAGLLKSTQLADLLESYLKPMKEKSVDQIVLGCTHYSFFKTTAEQIVGKDILILDSCTSVAKRTQYMLKKSNLLFLDKNEPKKISFLSSGLDKTLRHFVTNELQLDAYVLDFSTI